MIQTYHSNLYFDDALKTQLLQIALFEDCDFKYKYEACRELQLRHWKDEMTTDLVRLWGKGFSTFEISVELGVDEYKVKSKLGEFKLWNRRVR